MAFSAKVAAFLVLASLTSAFAIQRPDRTNETYPSMVLKHHRRAGLDPADFSWIKRWAAMGDSFTAGIGSGNLYTQERDDWKCSQYDHAYPAIINSALGPTIQDFQFVACSGDRSVQVFEQVSNLKGNLDLVMMTAGGNDLCLAGIIKTCVFLPFNGESKCQAIIDKAQQNVDTILKPNLKEILLARDDRMNADSVVVYNMYAQYFNTDNEACSTNQSWAFPKLSFSPLKLNIDRRKKFNTLVSNINRAIQEVIDDVTRNSKVKYKIGASDWDPWPRDGVSGQYWDSASTGRYPDAQQPDLQFFKPDTFVSTSYQDELRKRRTPEEEREILERIEGLPDIYDSVLWKSVDPSAEALHKLNPRAPAPPDCPGDGGFDFTLGLGIPDAFGKNHDRDAEVLGVADPSCIISDEFKCWQTDGRKGYANVDRLNENYKKFCDQVTAPANTVGWKSEMAYNKGTPDEHSFLLQLSSQPGSFDKGECLQSFDRIINGCHGNDDKNPMNWKFGGRYVRGEYTYEVNIKRDNRPWPPIQKPYGACEGWYKVFYSDYKLRGAGWSTWDSGEQTLRPSIKGYLGPGITAWKFEYYDEPDRNGMEWSLSVNLPILVRAKCFSNNKTAHASGGFTDGCKGND